MKNRISIKKIFIITLISILFITTLSAKNGFDLSNSSIPVNEIRFGGPGKDGIPSIDTSIFISVSEMKELTNSDFVLGVNLNGIRKAYPIRILNWHEIVNDQFGQTQVVITYCPLCGSGIAFNATIDGKDYDFGVSGLLYNSDVLLYDRQTESLWSQIKSEAISGELLGTKLEILPMQHTTWKDWKEQYPDTLVLDFDTGHFRDYSYNPYQGYENTSRLYFPVSFLNRGLTAKDKVIGLELDGITKAWPFKELKKYNGVLEDNLNGKTLYIDYDSESDSATIRDSEGKLLPGITLFWFAWSGFNPETEIYFFDAE